MLLSKYEETIKQAYYAQSFFPEKAAKRIVKDYSEELEEDLKILVGKNNYQEKYERYFLSWITAIGRCMSPMITGPANFPVARNQKHRDIEQRRYEEWRAWRSRYFKAVNRERILSPEEDLEKALRDLDKQIITHETMKGVNRIVRKRISDKDKIKSIIEEYGIPEEKAAGILSGFQGFSLTNSNAKIKRLKEKVLTMKARIESKKSWDPISFEGGVIDIENDRVVIRHDEKPDRAVIDKIKSKGFRWSRQ